MLNKEQMFVIYEFIDKHATKNVWNVSDELIKMALQIIKNEEKATKSSSNNVNNTICAQS